MVSPVAIAAVHSVGAVGAVGGRRLVWCWAHGRDRLSRERVCDEAGSRVGWTEEDASLGRNKFSYGSVEWRGESIVGDEQM